MTGAAVELHPLSFGADGRGRLFVTGGQLVRGVLHTGVDDIRDFIDHPVCRSLIDDELLTAARFLDNGHDLGYPLAIGHPLMPRITYPFEWTGPMLRDAALCFLTVAERAAQNGFLLIDAHPWNVVFQGPNPQVVDYGAFRRFVDAKSGVVRSFHPGDCFLRCFLGPLEVMATGHSSLARAFFLKHLRFSDRTLPPFVTRRTLRSALRRWVVNLLPTAAKKTARKIRDKAAPATIPASEEAILRTCRMLRSKVDALPFPPGQSSWTYYHDDAMIANPDSRKAASAVAKLPIVRDVVARLAPDSVTDLGCNRGFHSIDIARNGIPVVAIDSDDRCISDLYEHAKRMRLPITPVVMSVLRPSPTPALPSGHLVSVSSRLSGELTLVLAIMHHLVLSQGCDFLMLTDILGMYSKRWVLLEYVTPQDATLKRWKSNIPEWYNEESLALALSRRFKIREVIPTVVETRKLYLLEMIRHG